MSTDAERRTQRILQIADRIREAFPGKTLHPIGKQELGSRDELGLAHEQGIWGVYGCRNLSKASKIIADGLVVEPCRHLFRDLR